jgi:hypothetical protein
MTERTPSNDSRAHEHLFYSCLALAYSFTVVVGFSRTYISNSSSERRLSSGSFIAADVNTKKVRR